MLFNEIVDEGQDPGCDNDDACVLLDGPCNLSQQKCSVSVTKFALDPEQSSRLDELMMIYQAAGCDDNCTCQNKPPHAECKNGKCKADD